MDGLLPIWKPSGITSYDVIRTFKHNYPGSKIGHAGTLDPFAQGVLILMLGKATRRFGEIQQWGKTYRALARLGAYSDTLDLTGKIVKSEIVKRLEVNELQEITRNFVGVREQVIPQYSAAKYQGKPLYKYARAGVDTPQKQKKVTVYGIKIGKITMTNGSDDLATAEMTVECGSGTYIRQLSYDIYKMLGIESYLEELVREKIGEIDKKMCLEINELESVDKVRKQLLLSPGASET